MYDQIATYFERIFSSYQCGFRNGYSSQQCLLAITEKWKKIVDTEGVFGVRLTDLSKAFDDYLSNRKQRVKVNDAYS